MSTVLIKHPTLSAEKSVPESALESWQAAGWIPLLDDEQRDRLDEIEREVDAAAKGGKRKRTQTTAATAVETGPATLEEGNAK